MIMVMRHFNGNLSDLRLCLCPCIFPQQWNSEVCAAVTVKRRKKVSPSRSVPVSLFLFVVTSSAEAFAPYRPCYLMGLAARSWTGLRSGVAEVSG